MNNEKICPVYSASDNTARKCIKEECGWWCDQCNACAVVSASDSDIYVCTTHREQSQSRN